MDFIFTQLMQNKSDNKNTFIVIAAYNEDAVIRDVVTELVNENYHVVVVDDGSANLQKNALSNLPITVLRHAVNLGQGAALRTGIKYAVAAGAEYLVTFDADGQHAAADIRQLLTPLQTNEADITLGSRFLTGSSHNMPLRKKIILYSARYINFIFTGLFLSDAHNGLRAMNRKAATSIQIYSNGMAHATEILYYIKKAGIKYLEIPVNVRYTKYSIKKGQPLTNSIKIFFDLLAFKIFK